MALKTGLRMKVAGVATPVRIQRARQEDSRTLAHLFRLSSGGLADYVWRRSARPGEDILDVGARQYRRSSGAFSFENCLVAEMDGEVVGMVHAHPMGEPAPDRDRETDPVLRSFQLLEDPGSLHVACLSVVPFARCVGIGSFLLRAAGWWAGVRGLRRLSLVCFERNAGAMALYRRAGLREVRRQPVAPHPLLDHGGGDAVLFVGDCLWGVPTENFNLERDRAIDGLPPVQRRPTGVRV